MANDTATLTLRVRNDKYVSDLKKSSKATKELSGAATLAKSSVAALAAGFAVGVIATRRITRAFSGFTKEALSLSRGLAEVSTLIDTSDPLVMKGLKKGILEVSSELGFLTSDSVPALYQALSASVPRENVISFIKTAGKAAVAGVTDLEVAVDGLTSVINAYGLEAEDAERLSDIFFVTIKRGKTRFEELSRGIGLVAPLANAAGVEIEELFGILAALTKQGLRTDIALTGVRGTLTSLLNPNEKLKELMRQLTAAGVDMNIRTAGVIQVLKNLEASVDGDKKAIAELIPNVRGLNAVFALLKDNAKGVEADIKAAREEVGAFDEAAKKMLDDQSQKARTLAADYQQIKQELGEIVKETGFVGWLAKAAKHGNAVVKSINRGEGAVRNFGKALLFQRGEGEGFFDAFLFEMGGVPSKLEGAVTTLGEKIGGALKKGVEKVKVPLTEDELKHWMKLVGEAADAVGKESKKLSPEEVRKRLEAQRALELDQKREKEFQKRLRGLKQETRIQKLINAGKDREAFIQKKLDAAGKLNAERRERLAKAAGRLFDLQSKVTEAGPAGPSGPSASLAAAMSEGSAEAMNTLRKTRFGGPEEETAKNTESIDKTLKRSLGKGMALVPVNLGAQ